MMKITNRVLALVLALIVTLSATVAFTQQAAKPGAKQGGEKECPYVKATKASLDKLEKTLSTGSQTSDPAKMKASIEQAQTELAEARKNMSMCPMLSGGMHHDDMDHMDHMMSPGNDKKQ
jgi:hypothetical protein